MTRQAKNCPTGCAVPAKVMIRGKRLFLNSRSMASDRRPGRITRNANGGRDNDANFKA